MYKHMSNYPSHSYNVAYDTVQHLNNNLLIPSNNYTQSSDQIQFPKIASQLRHRILSLCLENSRLRSSALQYQQTQCALNSRKSPPFVNNALYDQLQQLHRDVCELKHENAQLLNNANRLTAKDHLIESQKRTLQNLEDELKLRTQQLQTIQSTESADTENIRLLRSTLEVTQKQLLVSKKDNEQLQTNVRQLNNDIEAQTRDLKHHTQRVHDQQAFINRLETTILHLPVSSTDPDLENLFHLLQNKLTEHMNAATLLPAPRLDPPAELVDPPEQSAKTNVKPKAKTNVTANVTANVKTDVKMNAVPQQVPLAFTPLNNSQTGAPTKPPPKPPAKPPVVKPLSAQSPKVGALDTVKHLLPDVKASRSPVVTDAKTGAEGAVLATASPAAVKRIENKAAPLIKVAPPPIKKPLPKAPTPPAIKSAPNQISMAPPSPPSLEKTPLPSQPRVAAAPVVPINKSADPINKSADPINKAADSQTSIHADKLSPHTPATTNAAVERNIATGTDNPDYNNSSPDGTNVSVSPEADEVKGFVSDESLKSSEWSPPSSSATTVGGSTKVEESSSKPKVAIKRLPLMNFHTPSLSRVTAELESEPETFRRLNGERELKEPSSSLEDDNSKVMMVSPRREIITTKSPPTPPGASDTVDEGFFGNILGGLLAATPDVTDVLDSRRVSPAGSAMGDEEESSGGGGGFFGIF